MHTPTSAKSQRPATGANTRRIRRAALWMAVPAILLSLALSGCGGGSSDTAAAAPVASGGTSTPTPTSTAVVSSGVGPAGGTVESPQGVRIEVPSGALSSTVSISISSDASAAPSIASGVTATGAVFALLPHGTSFATAVTVTVPFDPSLIPAGVTPRLYKAEVGGSFTEIPSTVAGTTLVALVTNFSWVHPGITGAPSAPQAFAEADDKSVRVSWTGVAGESYQVCEDLTPGVVLPGQSFYPSQCVSASPPYTFHNLTNDAAYSFAVIASNSAGQAESSFVTTTPKALARTWTSYATGSYDPYSSQPAIYGDTGYNDAAYLRMGGTDYYIAVKSTHQTMRIVNDADPVHQGDQGPLLYTLRGVAGGNGYFIAVGDNGTIGVSGDGGLRWSFAQMGTFAGEYAYTSVAYVPGPNNSAGRFLAVGTWNDSNGQHDLITTIDPTIGSTGITTFLPGIYHQKFQQYSAPAAVSSQGVVVGNGNGNYYDYPNGALAILPGGVSYKASGNFAAGTTSAITIVQSFQDGLHAFTASYGVGTRIVFFNSQYWGLTHGTGGNLSSDGLVWGLDSNHSFQIHNPDPSRYTTGLVAGPGQMVAVSVDGEFFYNSTGGNNINSWTDIYTYTQMGNNPRVIYGNGRYIAVGTAILKSQ
jgi:hypothetical protein